MMEDKPSVFFTWVWITVERIEEADDGRPKFTLMIMPGVNMSLKSLAVSLNYREAQNSVKKAACQSYSPVSIQGI